MIELTILGTSSMCPTKDRNVQSIALNYKGEVLLIDCGEGTQRQMNIANINRNRINKIFITHWHGDHIGGLIGLIQTIGNQLGQIQTSNNNKKEDFNNEIYNEKLNLDIFGPIGTKNFMKHLLQSCEFDSKMKINVSEFDCKSETLIYENEDYEIKAINLNHKAKCLGYSFIEKDKIKIDKGYLNRNKIPGGPHLKNLKLGKDSKYKDQIIEANKATYLVEGKKISFVIDTKLCNNAITIAKNSDILICESSFAKDLKDKADQYKHLTSEDAANIAKTSNSKKLILTHISQRYKSCDEIVDEAKVLFSNTVCAYDFMKVKF